jgi:predicted  nucleic acid-binding Zn-ribbon protein
MPMEPKRPMNPPKPMKATLLKLFVINNDGEYAGEYAVDEDCMVEYADCIAAMGNAAVEDMQTILMGKLRITMIAGSSFNLIAVSSGPLGSQELTWAKATLTMSEAVFSRVLEDRKQQPPVRDEGLVSELKTVKGKLSEVESQLMVEMSKAEHETMALKEKVTVLQSKVGRAGDLEKQLAAAAGREQQLKREMQSKQESMRGIEMTISRAIEREEELRRQYDSIKAENENLKSMAASVSETKREFEARMELINRKAAELLEKEEKLKMRERNMQTLPIQVVGSER